MCMPQIMLEEESKTSREHQRRINPIMSDVVKREVLKLLEAGIIYPKYESKWVSPVYFVPKKGGVTIVKNDKGETVAKHVEIGWRMCIDYRKLSKATRKYHFPLPFIDQMLERITRYSHFCYLDGYSGFFQIQFTPTTKKIPLSHIPMPHLPTDECGSVM